MDDDPDDIETNDEDLDDNADTTLLEVDEIDATLLEEVDSMALEEVDAKLREANWKMLASLGFLATFSS